MQTGGIRQFFFQGAKLVVFPLCFCVFLGKCLSLFRPSLEPSSHITRLPLFLEWGLKQQRRRQLFFNFLVRQMASCFFFSLSAPEKKGPSRRPFKSRGQRTKQWLFLISFFFLFGREILTSTLAKKNQKFSPSILRQICVNHEGKVEWKKNN